MLSVEYMDMLSKAYRIAGDLEKAIAIHNETLRIFGGHALLHYELASLYGETGRPDEAILSLSMRGRG